MVEQSTFGTISPSLSTSSSLGMPCAHHAVDRGANAVGVTLEVKDRQGCPPDVQTCVVIDPLVDFGGGDAWLDMLGNIIEYPDIDSGRALNALDFFRAFKERTGNLLRTHSKIVNLRGGYQWVRGISCISFRFHTNTHRCVRALGRCSAEQAP